VRMWESRRLCGISKGGGKNGKPALGWSRRYRSSWRYRTGFAPSHQRANLDGPNKTGHSPAWAKLPGLPPDILSFAIGSNGRALELLPFALPGTIRELRLLPNPFLRLWAAAAESPFYTNTSSGHRRRALFLLKKVECLPSSLPGVTFCGQYVRFIQTLNVAKIFSELGQESLLSLSINP